MQRAELKWEEEHKTVEGRKQTEAETRTRYSALLSQGTTDAKINANDKAIATFSEAIRLDPGPPPPSMSVVRLTVIRAIMIARLPTTTKPFESIQRTQAPLVNDAELLTT